LVKRMIERLWRSLRYEQNRTHEISSLNETLIHLNKAANQSKI